LAQELFGGRAGHMPCKAWSWVAVGIAPSA